jgi:7-cyano-7-deazaguanine reductase
MAKTARPSPPAPALASRPRKIHEAAPVQRQAPPNPPTAPSKELHAFANPSPGRDYLIQFQIPEFTCLCPLTGQPDFAHFSLEVVPDRWCVELKSLKMYMWSFRDEGAFHEKVTNDILTKLVEVTAPRFARITARWNVRGGVFTTVVAEHRKKGWKPAPAIDLPALPRESGLPA